MACVVLALGGVALASGCGGDTSTPPATSGAAGAGGGPAARTDGPAGAPGAADAAQVATGTTGGPGLGKPWVVSLGDSYISGEGARWAGNTAGFAAARVDALGPTAYWDTPTGEAQKGCHRAPGAAAVHVGDEVMLSKNLACSGAQTSTKRSSRLLTPGLDFHEGPDGNGQLLELQRFAATHNVRVVAVSIGGNDFGFSTALVKCVAGYVLTPKAAPVRCSRLAAVREKFSAQAVAEVTEKIRRAYAGIGTAMERAGYRPDQYTVLALDYPQVLPPSSAMRYREAPGLTRFTIGGCGMWDADIDWTLGTILPTISRAIDAGTAASGLQDVRRMRLAGQYTGHRLCENTATQVAENTNWRVPGAVDTAEWVTQVRTATATSPKYQLAEGMHRNYWGNLSLRACLRGAVTLVQQGDGRRDLRCVPSGEGLTERGEPRMALTG